MQTTQALHTYFCVSDIGRVSVTGLESNSYLDNLADRVRKDATGAPITISEEVDRIYTNTGAEALFNDVCVVNNALDVQRHHALSQGSSFACEMNSLSAPCTSEIVSHCLILQPD
jgi:D-hexose-6-phosphate mutarotase